MQLPNGSTPIAKCEELSLFTTGMLLNFAEPISGGCGDADEPRPIIGAFSGDGVAENSPGVDPRKRRHWVVKWL